MSSAGRQDRLDLEASKRKVAALTAPRNVVLVGASDRAGSWAARVWRNLNRYEFPGPIHLINPRRDTIWDRPCHADFKSLPEAPDHLVVLVPAAGVAEALRQGAAAGARSATVFSAGFGEAFDHESAALGRELSPGVAPLVCHARTSDGWLPLTGGAIVGPRAGRLAWAPGRVPDDGLLHPGEAAASRRCSTRGIGVVRPRGWRRFLWAAAPVWRCLLAGLNHCPLQALLRRRRRAGG